MQITKGRQNKPYKVVIYGPEGIGKSTFAAQFPGPLFIDTEGSTARMDVARLPQPTSWAHMAEMVRFVIENKPCQTLIIDTADWAEQLCKEYVIQSGGEKIKSIEDFGYGKGYTMLMEQFGRFLNKLSDVVESGVHVVLTADAWMRKFEQPDEMGAYDRWELKMEKKYAPLIKEWADMVLFANYKTAVIEDPKTKTKKAFGGQRVMFTTHHPAWDAKNRDGLPEELPFEFSQIAHLFNVEANPAQVAPTIVPALEPVKQEPVRKEPIKETKPEKAKEPEPVENPDLVAYPDALPKKIADLLGIVNSTAGQLLMAIGPTINGGLGYFPADMKLEAIPPEFWDFVSSAWETDFMPKLQEHNNEIPY